MVLLRRVLGDELRRQRLRQHRTLREVSSAARVSLGYLSEVERGQKEASSELLSSICGALDVPLSVVLRGVSAELAMAEHTSVPTPLTVAPAPVVPADPAELVPAELVTADLVPTDIAPAPADVVASAA
jgi:transcriptional regulator with XRE-family HTH domain